MCSRRQESEDRGALHVRNKSEGASTTRETDHLNSPDSVSSDKEPTWT